MSPWRGVILLGPATLAWLAGAGSGAAQARLPNLRVAGKTPCAVHPETAAATADLWLAAREALTSSIHKDSAAPGFLIQQWRRTLDTRQRLRFERRDTSTVTTAHPFEKPFPGNLERAGYIQQRGWTTVYYGPDAGLLLSDWFLRRHCFSRVSGNSASEGLVGLAFEPLQGSSLSDVAGVLWIDLGSAELRYLEYRWTNAPPGIGGRADFVRLKSGGWIIQRWNIRMRSDDGFTDQGGEVLAIR